MASLADDNGVNGKAGKAPIATHPAFPLIVALWFAALLGIGSLVVPVALIEQLTLSTGLSAFVPATAPPLGFTARALIALGSTAAGAIAGLLIARQIARAQGPQTARRYPTDRAQGPIFAHAELGADGLDGDGPAFLPRGRRSLAIDVEHSPSELLDFAPLPGKRMEMGISTLELLDPEARGFADEAWADDEGSAEELELTEDDHFMDEDLPQSSQSIPRQEFRPVPAPVHDFELVWDDDEDEEAEEPAVSLSFSPPSLTRGDEAPPPAGEMIGHPLRLAPLAEPVSTNPELDDLGLVQLAQRLGNSIERRRERLAAQAQLAATVAPSAVAAVTPAVPPPLGEDVEAAAPDEAAEAKAAYFAGPAVSEDAPESAAETASESPATEWAADIEPESESNWQVFQAEPAPREDATYRAPSGFAQLDIADEDENWEDPDYASLLALHNPFHEHADAFVRIEDEPEEDDSIGQSAVVFPVEALRAAPVLADPTPLAFAPAPTSLVDSEENQRALREALLGLQRMSGAA